jgi:hypothetical protein
LVETISEITGIRAAGITLIFGRRGNAVGYMVNTETANVANAASDAISTASTSGTLLTILLRKLNATSYSGSLPTDTSASAVVEHTSSDKSSSSGSNLPIVLGCVITAGALLIILGLVVVVRSLACSKVSHSNDLAFGTKDIEAPEITRSHSNMADTMANAVPTMDPINKNTKTQHEFLSPISVPWVIPTMAPAAPGV